MIEKILPKNYEQITGEVITICNEHDRERFSIQWLTDIIQAAPDKYPNLTNLIQNAPYSKFKEYTTRCLDDIRQIRVLERTLGKMQGISIQQRERMKVVYARNIAAAHNKLMSMVLWDHVIRTTEEGELTWEFPEPITLVISYPISDEMIHPKSSFQQQKCGEYADQLLNGVPNEFDYDYHTRLFSYSIDGVTVNQIYHVIRKLQEHPGTRRAVAITWNPHLDNGDASVPCLQFIQFIKRKNGLDMICVFRSEDILSAFGPNAYGLSQLLLYVADRLNIPVGTYTHIITVPHLYPVRDKADLQRWL